jgi:hypothetical protein
MQKSEQPHIELARAKAAVDAMKESTTLDQIEEAWKVFLHCIERVWNKTASHYAKSPKWNGWQGKFLKFRKDDQLLVYFIHARGAEEHTVEEIVGRESGGIGINAANGNSLYIERMVINGPNVWIKSPQALRIDFIPARTVLRPITNRGRVYPVPTEHLGKKIDPNNVVQLAEAGLTFYTNLVEEVEAAFIRKQERSEDERSGR